MADFTLTRGLKNVVYAEITKDDGANYTVGDVKPLIPSGNLATSVNSSTNDTYFDNALFYRAGQEAETTVTIDGAFLRPSQIAELTGKKVDTTTGAIIDDGTYHEKFFAVGAEIGLVDGTKMLVWFLKGTFGYPAENAKTEDASTDTNGMQLVYSAVRTINTFNGETGCKRVICDTAESKIKAEGDWFAQVVTPANVGTIIEKNV